MAAGEATVPILYGAQKVCGIMVIADTPAMHMADVIEWNWVQSTKLDWKSLLAYSVAQWILLRSFQTGYGN